MMDITVVQAWPYPPRISAFIVLYELGLWEMCETNTNDCKVSVNGLPLDLQDQRLLRHGDYILIRIAPSRGPDGRVRLRQAFGILEDFEGLEYTTETGISRISGDGLRAQRSTATPYHVPQTRRHASLHEGYWICMGFFVWCGALALLSLQIRREPRLPRPARTVGGQRFGLAEHRKQTRAPWMLIWLVLSQPVLPAVEGLQLPPQGDFGIAQPYRQAAGEHLLLQSESWRPTGCLVQLTPPGNPDHTNEDYLNAGDDFLQRSITAHGQCMRQLIPLIWEARHLQFQLAVIHDFIDCKVHEDTEFATTITDLAVRSTLPGKAEESMPDDPIPQVNWMQQGSWLERSVDVDKFLPIANEVHAPSPIKGDRPMQPICQPGNTGKHREDRAISWGW